MNKQTIISIVVIVVAVVAGLVILQTTSKKTAGDTHKYDALASCLGEKGATFYGAFWCPHCNEQKKMFQNSVKLLPYVECSNPDGKSQTEACIAKQIQSYPTWEFADGTRLTGEQSAETLAAKTGCESTLPSSPSSQTPTTSGESTEVVPN